MVLVDDGLDAAQFALWRCARPGYRRRPPQSQSSPCPPPAAIASISTISTGSGEATTRRQPRPASSTTCQPSVSKLRARFLVHKAANRLGRVLKGRVVGFDPRLRDQRDALARDVARMELVVQRLLQHVADAALRVRHNQVERAWYGPHARPVRCGAG